MKKITDEQLWDLIDGFLSNDEKVKIEQEIEQNNEIKARFSKIQAEKSLFSTSSIEKPTTDFASKLLQNWQVEQQSISLETTIAPANYTILKMVFVAFGLLSLVLFFLVYFHSGVSENIEINFPRVVIPWKSITLLFTVFSAVLTVSFIEKWITIKLNRSLLGIN